MVFTILLHILIMICVVVLHSEASFLEIKDRELLDVKTQAKKENVQLNQCEGIDCVTTVMCIVKNLI